ncbi:MAG: domain/HD domain protein [Myxococcales bacterium]|nr:domain/HD domain protein [Myxococcales bacterium]
MKLQLRLASRLALLFLAAGLVPLGVTLLVLAPRGQDALRTSAKLLHQAELEGLQSRIDGALDDLLSDVRIVATTHAGEANEAERRARLKFLLDKHQELTIATLYADGQKLPGAQAFDRTEVSPTDLDDHERRARPLLGGGANASDFYASARRREMLITLVIPLPGQARYLATELSLKRVQELIARTHVGRRGIAYIVDRHGQLVAHPNLQRVLGRADLSSVPIVAQLIPNIERAVSSRPLTVVTDFSDEGKDQVGAFAPLARLRWGLVVAEPREDAYGLARATWAHAGGWTALALALSLMAAVFFARNITRPVAKLVAGTRGLAGGAFGITVPVDGPDEIKELARTFNEASLKLDQYDADNRKLLLAVERRYLEVLRALVNAIEAKDPYTAGHSQRTAEFAVAIARHLKLELDEVKEIEVGGLLHDIGKIGIAEQILRKPAQLDDAEMRVMRGHPAIGDGIVGDIEMLGRIRSMVRNHHERWDGSGYPDGLRGEDIPLGARIIAVADTYDAITSDRCYQPGRPPAESVPILRRLADVQLDGGVVDALLRALVEMGQLTAEDVAQPPIAGAVPAPTRRRPTLEIMVPTPPTNKPN